MNIDTTHCEAFSHCASTVWHWLGSFDGLASLSSATILSRLEDGGRVRVLNNRDGSILWERLLHFSESDRILRYMITDAKGFQGAYGIGYIGEVAVEETGPDTCVFRYSASFEPMPGFDQAAARTAVAAFASDCAAGVRQRIQANTECRVN